MTVRALAFAPALVAQRVFGEGDYLRPSFIQPYRCRDVLIEPSVFDTKGARLGYLAPEHRALAERAFAGMLASFVTVGPDGLVSINGICNVAGLGGNPPRDGSYEYYVSEPVVANDYKGVGAFMLAAIELGK